MVLKEHVDWIADHLIEVLVLLTPFLVHVVVVPIILVAAPVLFVLRRELRNRLEVIECD